MPLYEWKCSNDSCKLKGVVVEEFSAKVLTEDSPERPSCRECKELMVKQLSACRRDSWPEGGIVLEHIADKPMRFERKSDLRKYCKEKGLSSGALL